MPLIAIPGRGSFLPTQPPMGLAPAFGTGLVIDATGEKAAFQGAVWFPARTGSKSLRYVWIRLAAVTKAGGSALTLSVQDIGTAGPPAQPDEVQDQTFAIANADAGFVSNSWYRAGPLSADRTVAFGAEISIVVEYDGAGRLGADTVTINTVTVGGNSLTQLQNACSLKTGGTFAVNNAIANVLLEFTDGTFGTLDGAVGWSAINTHTYNSGSATADEHALAFQVPWECVIDQLWTAVSCAASSSDFDLVLYQGTSALVTSSVDANKITATATARYLNRPIADTALSPSTQYYLSVKPTTANNVSAYSMDVSSAAQWDGQDAGQNFNYSSRIDAGSWAAITTTRRLLAGVRLSALSDGAGGGIPMSRVFTGQ